jgi:hypothetical protein
MIRYKNAEIKELQVLVDAPPGESVQKIGRPSSKRKEIHQWQAVMGRYQTYLYATPAQQMCVL